jgi:hypothetical protein
MPIQDITVITPQFGVSFPRFLGKSTLYFCRCLAARRTNFSPFSTQCSLIIGKGFGFRGAVFNATREPKPELANAVDDDLHRS